MQTRTFRFEDGKSDKFWSVTLDGSRYSVQFGRWGTQGQTQVKEFPSASAAEKAYSKLVAEKLGKGYVEISDQKSAPAAPKPAAVVPAPPRVEPSPRPAPPVPVPSTEKIRLSPADWHVATWRNCPPLPRPEPKPFDFQDCLNQFGLRIEAASSEVRLDKLSLEPALSRQEAHFWLVAFSRVQLWYRGEASLFYSTNWDFVSRREKHRQDILDGLAAGNYHGAPSLDEAIQIARNRLSSDLLLPLFWLFPITDIGRFYAETAFHPQRNIRDGRLLQRSLAPYLTVTEREELRAAIEPQFATLSEVPMDVYDIAAAIGSSHPIRRAVAKIPDGHFAESLAYPTAMQRTLFGLPSAAEVATEFRRLKLPLTQPDHIRGWLAHTELSDLAYVRDSIQTCGNRDDAAPLIEAFADAMRCPEAAPIMLELSLSSKAPQVARKWLDDHPLEAIAGLIPVAAGRGTAAESAIEFLRSKMRAGHGEYIDSLLTGDTARLRQELARTDDRHIPELDPAQLDPGLKAAFHEADKLRAKDPAWIDGADLPPVLIGSQKLPIAQSQWILRALSASDFSSPHPLLLALRVYADPASLARFSWALFEKWQQNGAQGKDKWALQSLGLFGDDKAAIRLASLIRQWPGEGKHQMAVHGLDALRGMATNTALMQINGIAQKVKFQAIKVRARECMEAIAQERGMLREQLEDLIVPDCGLDERGTRIFDFGPRQFRMRLGPGLKPLIEDADRQRKPDLPKPNSKDDAAKAEAAIEEWKMVKKQVADTAKIQARRLEMALITQRRWTPEEFRMLLVEHPLMTNLAQTLLWGAWDSDNRLLFSFRVADDWSYSSAADDRLTLEAAAAIGLVHPMQLQPAELRAWGEHFSDYELTPPFPQLGRPVHRLAEDERAGDEISRLKGSSFEPLVFAGTLEKLGWVRGVVMDGGGFLEYSKQFQSAGVTAMIEHSGLIIGMIGESDPPSFEHCYFTKGGYVRGQWGAQKSIPLSEVDEIVLSEVLADLELLAQKRDQ